MANVVVPKWGLTMESAEVLTIVTAIGDRVSEGDPLFELETDKITQDLESPVSGVVSAIYVVVGQTVAPGDIVATVEP